MGGPTTLRPDGTTAVDVRALDDELGVAHGRLLSPEPVKKFAQSLHNRGETSQLAALQHLSALLAASPHNRHVCAGPGGLVGLLLGQLARLDDGARGAALGVLQQLGAHRFTVHDTRSFLAALPALEAAIGRGGPEGEHAAERARELLELLCSITRLGSEPTGGDLRKF